MSWVSQPWVGVPPLTLVVLHVLCSDLRSPSGVAPGSSVQVSSDLVMLAELLDVSCGFCRGAGCIAAEGWQQPLRERPCDVLGQVKDVIRTTDVGAEIA
jgi:hypothetical protein